MASRKRRRQQKLAGSAGRRAKNAAGAAARGGAKKQNWFMRMALWQRVLVCLCGVVLVGTASAAAFVASKWSKVDSEDISAGDVIINEEVQANVDLGEGYTNIALFGVDSRDGELESGTRTDMIIVASLNNETKEIRLVSVYRDTLLNLSDGTYRKCNAAYSYGGATMAMSMLNMNLDLDIEEYVTVDFSAIADAIDLLGGVEITLEEAELEAFNKYVTETANVVGKEANKIEEAGTYLMDGVQATTYARIRSTSGGDFTRTERQRIVIEKMVEKVQEADLATLNAIVDEVFPQISTSFTLQEILTYVSAYTEYTLTESAGFPFEKGTDTISGLGSIVYPLDDLAENVTMLHEFLFDTEDYEPSSVVQEISETINSYLSPEAEEYTDTDDTLSSSTSISNSSNSSSSDNSDSNSSDSSGGSSSDSSDSSSGSSSSDSSSSSGSSDSSSSSSSDSSSSGSSGSSSSGSSDSSSSSSSDSSGSSSSDSSDGSSGSSSSGGSDDSSDSGSDSSGSSDDSSDSSSSTDSSDDSSDSSSSGSSSSDSSSSDSSSSDSSSSGSSSSDSSSSGSSSSDSSSSSSSSSDSSSSGSSSSDSSSSGSSSSDSSSSGSSSSDSSSSGSSSSDSSSSGGSSSDSGSADEE